VAYSARPGSTCSPASARPATCAPLDALESEHRDVLRTLARAAEDRPKDWTRFQQQAIDFHLRNARAWADKATGTDLSAQVDPEFVHGPHALAAVSA